MWSCLAATELLERTCEMSLLGECFLSLSETVVSWEEVFGGDAGVCYYYLPPSPISNCWFFPCILLAFLGTPLQCQHSSPCLVSRAG